MGKHTGKRESIHVGEERRHRTYEQTMRVPSSPQNMLSACRQVPKTFAPGHKNISGVESGFYKALDQEREREHTTSKVIGGRGGIKQLFTQKKETPNYFIKKY